MKKHRYRRPLSAATRKIILWLGLLCFVLAVVLTFADYRLRPVIEAMAAHQAKVAAIRSINAAMDQVLTEEGITYEDIVRINQTASGEINSIQTNMQLVNRLKINATDRILEQIALDEANGLRIPLGNLTGLQFLSGRGPEVEIRVIPIGYVQTRLYNQFSSAGINQTLHRIMLETGIQVLVVLPGYTIQADTVTDYCVAETVIVGKIPEGYAGINLEDTPTVARIQDHYPIE